MNSTQYNAEAAGLWYPAGDVTSSNLKPFAPKEEIIAPKIEPHLQESFVQQEIAAGPLPFYEPYNHWFSSDELLSRFLKSRDEQFDSVNHTIPAPAGIDSGAGQLIQLLPSASTQQNCSSALDINYCGQHNQAYYVGTSINAVSNLNRGVVVNQDATFSEPQAVNDNKPADPARLENLARPSVNMMGLVASITPAEEFGPTESYHTQESRHKKLHQDTSWFAPIVPSETIPGSHDAPSFGMMTSEMPPFKPEDQEILINQKEYDNNPFENFEHQFLESEDIVHVQSIREKTGSPSGSSCIPSNFSSQFGTPSLSSSSLNSRSSSYTPSHPMELSNFRESPLILQNSNTSFLMDFESQNVYQQDSPEEFSNFDTNSNSFNFMKNGRRLDFENFYPFQLTQKLTLLEKLQQLKSNERYQLLENNLPPPASHCPIATVGAFGRSQVSKVALFICPRCGKGHTRQSNLLAHLRDTHSKVKKVFCDVPGCTKSYKRVSECRRHKKDVHKIPLPSEINGKVRKPRSTMASVFRTSKPKIM